MQITNSDNDLIIDYQESDKKDDDVVVRVSRFSDGRTDKQTFTKDEAVKDMTDFLVNYNYHRVGLRPYQQTAVMAVSSPMFLPAGIGKS